MIIALAATYVMALGHSVLERMRPEYNADVLAQKARDAIARLGYTERQRDEAYGFDWDDGLIERREPTKAQPRSLARSSARTGRRR